MKVRQPDGDAVVVAYLSSGENKETFDQSWEALRLHDLALHQRTYPHFVGDRNVGGGRIQSWCAAGTLEKGRNDLVKMFLEEYDAPWLMWFDSDMGFEPDTIERLIEAADPDERPIMGGLAFIQKHMGFGDCFAPVHHYLPSLFNWDDARKTFMPIYDYPHDTVFQIAGTGSACVLIHRSVFEKIADKFGPYDWYWKLPSLGDDKMPYGEDLSFCLRAQAVGVPIYAHTGVRTVHIKGNHGIDERLYLSTRERASNNPTYVVIPVKDQLELTQHLLGQLEEQGGYEEIVVFDNGSGEETRRWLENQQIARVFDAEDANIHQMWNAGVGHVLKQNPAANIVFLNNDLDVGDKFLETLTHDLRADPNRVAISPNYDGRPIDGIEQVHGICANRYDGTGGLAGFAFAVRGEWFQAGYRFPEDLNWWYGDNDLCMSLELAGATYGITGNTTVVHVDDGGQTVKPDGWDDLIAQDKNTFETKWVTQGAQGAAHA